MGRASGLRAAGPVPAAPQEVFDFLADLENHWELAGRFVEVLSLDRARDGAGPAHGGRVRMRGPLRVSRIADTRVEGVDPPRGMWGTARLGPVTRATVRWSLRPRGDGSWVSLAASVESAGALDRLLLAIGARVWLRRLLAGAIARLAARFERPAQASSPRAASATYSPSASA